MGIVATKTTEIHAALASGGRIVTLGSIPSLDRFQAQAIWEMSVKENSLVTEMLDILTRECLR